MVETGFRWRPASGLGTSIPVVLVSTLIAACAPTTEAEPPAPESPPAPLAQAQPPVPAPLEPSATPVEDGFEAVVRIDAEPGGKRFQGVWLERSDGERWVIAYRPLGIWADFEGKTVKVTGETYRPEGQAISATHFRVSTLRFEHDAPSDGLVAVGPQVELSGKIVERHGTPGSKMAKGSWTAFVTDDTSYVVENSADVTVSDIPVEVKGRVVELSPYVAHMGPRIWILD
jgi:hypothetical protein